MNAYIRVGIGMILVAVALLVVFLAICAITRDYAVWGSGTPPLNSPAGYLAQVAFIFDIGGAGLWWYGDRRETTIKG